MNNWGNRPLVCDSRFPVDTKVSGQSVRFIYDLKKVRGESVSYVFVGVERVVQPTNHGDAFLVETIEARDSSVSRATYRRVFNRAWNRRCSIGE